MTREHIIREVDPVTGHVDPGAWLCLCGNTPASSGFYPVSNDGEWISPAIDGEWNEVSYGCSDCGRIIDQHTLEVTGQMTESALTKDQPN